MEEGKKNENIITAIVSHSQNVMFIPLEDF